MESELQSNNLVHAIDSKVTKPKNIDEESTIKRNGLVRDIIINHLDEEYHARILNIKDPRVVLEKLKEYKRCETNITQSSVKTWLYQLKIKNNVKIYDLRERFD